MLSSTRFVLIGQTVDLLADRDWNNPGLAKLTLYNLHYFDDLRAHDAAMRSSWHRDLIRRWIAENSRASGIGWEPYPISLRIVNWIAWALAGNEFDPAVRDSLADQTRVLKATLEFHLLGNHLLANAKALVFAGCYFSGLEGETWLRTGLNLLNAQWREQILADGGHFELSPMYHAILLEDVLDLVQLARIFPQELGSHLQEWSTLAARMLAWLGEMTHPDGEIAFFNDATFGVARSHSQLAEYARQLEINAASNVPLRDLTESGYVRLQSGPLVAIFDMAEVGPTYLPGHAHADTLSLEVSVDGRRLITNSGISCYEQGAAREEERSTSAHATVEIDGCNSSEVWASFRVGRRAHAMKKSVAATGSIQSASASHDGYRWLAGQPVHHREVVVSPTSLIVRDRITGAGKHSVVGRFPLHPSVGCKGGRTEGWQIDVSESRTIRFSVKGCSDCFVADGYYSPSFGQRIKRPVLTWREEGLLPVEIESRFEF